ncbi:hypothetical protein EG68_06563 [Paragonimus skrjabini miyazakii]|uniref:Uncharacterized protein n=1 Tax=Paragonimus skrjabini miyazakii TaxID=59628 RepID=A0A8S9YNC3_9TREM|nr:hypothetical protein EG68_06563 [Paragonimus skrjabini miyazakii]
MLPFEESFKMSFKIPRSEISRSHSQDKINNESFYFFGKTGSQEKCSSSQQTNSSLFSREEFEDSFSQSQSDDSQCFWTSLRKIWRHEDTFEENQELKPSLENAEALRRSVDPLLTELQEITRDVENIIQNLELSTHFKNDEENIEQICNLKQEILQYAESIQTFNETFQRKIQNCQNYLNEITNAYMKLRTVVEEISENSLERQLIESLKQWSYNDFQLTPVLSKHVTFLQKSGCNKNQTPFPSAELYIMKKCTGSSITDNPLSSERKKVRVSSVKMKFNRTPLTEQRRNNLRSVFSRSLLRTVPFVKPQPKPVKLSPSRSTWIDLSDGWNQKSIGQMFSISSPSSSSNSSDCLSFSSVSEI